MARRTGSIELVPYQGAGDTEAAIQRLPNHEQLFKCLLYV